MAETSSGNYDNLPVSVCNVEKIRYAKTKANSKTVDYKTNLIYNDDNALLEIPLETYGHIVNGKFVIEWVVERVIERLCVKIYITSDIVNDANNRAIENMSNPQYPPKLFIQVRIVSLETMKIVLEL